jgi:hypothetical protein
MENLDCQNFDFQRFGELLKLQHFWRTLKRAFVRVWFISYLVKRTQLKYVETCKLNAFGNIYG